MEIVKLGGLKDLDGFREACTRLGVELPIAEALGPALSRPCELFGKRLGNRFAMQPMEGWDGTRDGKPTDLTRRRWRRFGQSGADLIWGGEAVAVAYEGRANPNQLCIGPDCEEWLHSLREEVLAAHGGDPVIGLQLTHSGRWSRPDGEPKPIIARRMPALEDETPPPLISDGELRRVEDAMVAAAVCARRAGFDFVDIKHCHGYLPHELLPATDRPGEFGGSFENRTRMLRDVVAGVRAEAPGLGIGVRISAFDEVAFRPGPDGVGRPIEDDAPRFGAGTTAGEEVDFLRLCAELDIPIVNVTAGCPYYCPHVQRPAQYPPSDGYFPPEDPLVGVARHLALTRRLRAAEPRLLYVGSAYSYLQEFLPYVAEGAVAEGWTDFVGLGRMALSYPEMPADVLAGRPLQRKRLCRTFSDCTTAPRNGMVSGCYPLDPEYRARPERDRLEALKARAKE